MYGLVIKAIEDMVVTSFGNETWEKLLNEAGIHENIEIHNYYPDEYTYKLVSVASNSLKVKPEKILYDFGLSFTSFAGKIGYDDLMDMFGNSLEECLGNLNSLHSRMGLTLPELKPPKFELIESSKNQLVLEYHSPREGLEPFVEGLLQSLAGKFDTKIEIDYKVKKSIEEPSVFTIKII